MSIRSGFVFRAFLIVAPLLLLMFFSRHSFLHKALFASQEMTAPNLNNFSISDISKSSGIEFTHQIYSLKHSIFSNAEPWIQAVGVGVAVVDFDSDGLNDIFFANSSFVSSSKLFKNLGNKKFIDFTDKAFIKKEISNFAAFRPIFFDCDNDGRQDLLISTSQCPAVFKNEKGFFKKTVIESLPSDCSLNYYNVGVVDYNNDGFLDFISATYTGLPDNIYSSTNTGQSLSLYKNIGGCKFEVTKNNDLEPVGFTHAVGVADLRGKNKNDVWLVTDFGPDKIFFANGDGTYQNKSQLLSKVFNRHGMSFDINYEDNSDKPFIYVSHIFEPGSLIEGNALWKLNDDFTQIKNYAKEKGVDRCGFAWEGRFIDLNFDSYEDLIVANGFISQNREKRYNFFMSALLSTVKDHLGNYRNWPKMADSTVFGYEKDCIFMNDGKRFHKVTAANPLTEKELDGRGVALIDLTGNGDIGVLIANQKQELQLFEVEQKNNNQWIGFKLQGKCSNRDGLGAKLLIRQKDTFKTRYHYPTNGFAAQSQAAMIVGLGPSPQIDEIKLIWPSGFEQILTNYTLNNYNDIVEGSECEKMD